MAGPREWILDLFGVFIRQEGGWISAAGLVAALGDLGVEEGPARSAISRMKSGALLDAVAIDAEGESVPGYSLSPEGERFFDHGDARIFARSPTSPAPEGWVLAGFSVPENRRGRRHRLKSVLTGLGFAALGPGLMIAPAALAGEARSSIEREGLDAFVHLFAGEYLGFDDESVLAAELWDLDAIDQAYRRFLADHGPRHDRGMEREPLDDVAAFVAYLSMVEAWRSLAYLDPGLPPSVLPVDWRAPAAAEVFIERSSRLRPLAARHVRSLLGARGRAEVVRR